MGELRFWLAQSSSSIFRRPIPVRRSMRFALMSRVTRFISVPSPSQDVIALWPRYSSRKLVSVARPSPMDVNRLLYSMKISLETYAGM